MVNKTHAALCAIAGIAFVALTGCNTKDQLLAPQNPGIIDPSLTQA